MLDYDEYVMKYWDNFVKVTVSPKMVKKIEAFLPKLLTVKMKEDLHKIDGDVEFKRHMTGYLGEAALEKLFGINIIDWSIGPSRNYNTPDLKHYGIGIKTVEKGKFHVIFQENDYPQILCIKSDTCDNEIYVCGLARADVLNKYQDISLIKNQNLAARGVKTGFYGYEHLIPIRSIRDIAKYKKY